jgi:N-dimethylarginine dimethylaminohydrolase
LQQHIPKLIPVVEKEAERFACNAVVVGKHVVVNAGSDRLAADLRGAGYACSFVELDEFIKAGGSAKCLTLRLDGEDAAQW